MIHGRARGKAGDSRELERWKIVCYPLHTVHSLTSNPNPHITYPNTPFNALILLNKISKDV
jgi:hypothetical protein